LSAAVDDGAWGRISAEADRGRLWNPDLVGAATTAGGVGPAVAVSAAVTAEAMLSV